MRGTMYNDTETSTELLLHEEYMKSTDHEQRNGSSKPSKKLFAAFQFTKTCLLYLLAVWGAFSIVHRQTYSMKSTPQDQQSHDTVVPKGCDCGESVVEAISRGCKFDGLAMAWLPEHCRDDELAEEFNTVGDGPNGTWIYYADREHTIELDPADVAALGDHPEALVHMDVRWHTIHCIFYWRKQYRAQFSGKIVEPRSDSEHHIKHCGEIFLSPGSGTKSGVALNTNLE